jgi:hypothetical protein
VWELFGRASGHKESKGLLRVYDLFMKMQPISRISISRRQDLFSDSKVGDSLRAMMYAKDDMETNFKGKGWVSFKAFLVFK